MSVRVRIAPSPTGSLHVGHAYIALFNLAFARRHGGQFVLRIEDTDQARSRPEYEQRLFQSLNWLGLHWDEGPDVGGPCGPYRQSERLPIYQEHARQLVEAGHAYYCFCTPQRLDALRAEQRKFKLTLGYDRHCRDLPLAQAEQRRQGEAHVVRLKMPLEGKAVLQDTLRGAIEFEYHLLDDQVLLKSDGFPTYHLAVVVDDRLMGITHVIRGEEWINSSPKHLLLYERFGWTPPVYTHLPLLLNPDGSKMSKRRNATSVNYYRRAGYLGPALLNYLGLMSYPPPGEDEKFTLEQWVETFDLAKISLGGSVFDLDKLLWLNARYLREDLSPAALLGELKSWVLNDEHLRQLVPLMQERMETLGDFLPKCAFFFARRVECNAEDLVPKKREAQEVVQVLQTVLWALEGALPWGRDTVEGTIRKVSEFWSWPIREVTGPLFTAIMGQKVGPPLFESIALLGLDLTRARILDAMTVLGGLSKRRTEELEGRWKAGK